MVVAELVQLNITSLVFIFLLSGHAVAGARWKSFCERYLVADDPYQYERLTVDQLADVYLAQFNSGINTKTVPAAAQSSLVSPKSMSKDGERD